MSKQHEVVVRFVVPSDTWEEARSEVSGSIEQGLCYTVLQQGSYTISCQHEWEVDHAANALLPDSMAGEWCPKCRQPKLSIQKTKYDPFARGVEHITHEDAAYLTGEPAPLKVVVPGVVLEETTKPGKTSFQLILDQIRDAYRQVRNGALKRSMWVKEGASSYTKKRDK